MGERPRRGSMPRLVAINLVHPAHAAEEVQRAWGEGAAVLPLDPKAPSEITARTLGAMQPEVLISAAGGWTLHDPDPVRDDTAVVLLTSGSTGVPKGVELSYGALEASARLTHARLGAEPGDRWTCALPLHHVAGFLMLARSDDLGTEPEFLDPSDLWALGEARGNFVSLVPTQLHRCLEKGVDLGRFKAVLLGGAAVHPDLLARAAEAGINIIRTYGMTETAGGVVYDGVPLDEVSVRVGESELPGAPSSEVGSISVATPTLMTGYRGGEPHAGRWFDTNDVGRIEDERLMVLGRADDIINSGGEKVMPRDVENALLEHPSVSEAHVCGAPDGEWGEQVVAFVVADGASEDDIAASVRSRLARHEVPKRIVFVEALPKTGAGKIDRAAIRGIAPDLF